MLEDLVWFKDDSICLSNGSPKFDRIEFFEVFFGDAANGKSSCSNRFGEGLRGFEPRFGDDLCDLVKYG